jgi:hypothetical protein
MKPHAAQDHNGHPKACSLPFSAFHRFHEALNRTVKTSAASLHYARKAVARSRNPSEWLGAEIAETGEPWGNSCRWRKPEVELDAASLLLSEMAVVRVDSAFEEYYKSTSEAFCDWLKHCDKPIPEKESGEEFKLPAIKEVERFGWHHSAIQAFVPVLGYFSLLRNCIVHRNGRPSGALFESMESKELRESLDKWPKRKGSKPVELPVISAGMIQVLPRHPIFYSEVCHRLAKLIDKQFVSGLGLEGLVWMAARSAVLRAEALDSADVSARIEAYLSRLLSHRCLVTVNGRKLIPILRDLGIWADVRDRFNSLSAKHKAALKK